MNTLPIDKKVKILQMLVEGMSMRAVSRVADVSINTVTKVLCETGRACADYHDAHVRGVKAKRIECDEIWSFCYAKQKNVATATTAPEGAGDTWTWTAIDADSKLIISYLVGGRDVEYATEFMQDVKDRITGTTVQLTTDGLKAYLVTVDKTFRWNVNYAQLVKAYGNAPDGFKARYSPAEWMGSKKVTITGRPDLDKVSTSFVERQNLTMRMHMRRFTRLTNGFSKKIENHANAVALHFMFYNFCKIHKTLRVTPAMESGIANHVWSIEELLNLVSAPVAKKRGAYKPQISN